MALAFALDPGSLVIATERTSFSFPETRMGIYPRLRGTLTLPQCIYEGIADEELAVALSRYYILAGGTTTSSPRLLKDLGLADFLVPARLRDDVAATLAAAIIDNGGQLLSNQQLDELDIEELPSELTPEEKEELILVRDVFGRPDFLSRLQAIGQGQADDSFSEKSRPFSETVARRIAKNSPHAVDVANLLIDRGFDEYLEGKSLDERAMWELDNALISTFQHPDALEGLLALEEKRAPVYGRKDSG